MSWRAFTHFVMSTMAALQSEEGAESDHPNVDQEGAPPHPARELSRCADPVFLQNVRKRDAGGGVKSTQKCGSLTEGGAESNRPNMSRNERQRTSSRARSRRYNPRKALKTAIFL